MAEFEEDLPAQESAGEDGQGIDGNDRPTIRVKIRMQMEPEQFAALRGKFIEDLAKALSIEPGELKILDIYRGCTVAIVELPYDAGGLLLDLNELAGSSEEQRELVRRVLSDFLVSRVSQDNLAEYAQIRIRRGGRKLNWLHLSDVHFKNLPAAKQRAQNRVVTKLSEQLPSLLEKSGIEPHCVFFTGDIAFSGKAEEYAVANRFFATLTKKLPGSPRCFFVPGNHDVDRSVLSNEEENTLRQRLVSDEAVHEFLSPTSAYPEAPFQRLSNFFAFSEKCSSHGQPPMNHGYFYTQKINHKGVSVGIAGLNSAWRCASNQDTATLVLGTPQMETVSEELEGVDLKLALVHHPPASEWFAPFDRQFHGEMLLQQFDFILRGHEHEPDSHQQINLGSGRQWYHIAAGALYQTESYVKTINAVSLNLDTGSAVIFHWLYFEKEARWEEYAGRTRKGYCEQFRLHEDLRNPLRRARDRPNSSVPDRRAIGPPM